MGDVIFQLPLGAVLLGWMLAGGSPGPATLAICGTSMQYGRRAGLTLAAGVMLGSATWGIAAGLGLSAMMLAHVWIFEVIRYLGVAYLMLLAIKSLRAACRGGEAAVPLASGRKLFSNGALLHLTNPKAVLSWGAVYAIVLAPGAGWTAIWALFAMLLGASTIIFFGYALLFSSARIAAAYARAKRGFEAAFGLLFGLASLKILTARLI